MKVIDIVKPAPKTELEEYEFWRNRYAVELQRLPYYHKIKIEVKYDG